MISSLQSDDSPHLASATPSEPSGDANAVKGGASPTQNLLHSTIRTPVPPRCTLIDPANAGPHSLDDVAEARHVGFQYLRQLALTSLPLVLVDLAMLTGAILVARWVVRYVGIGTGIDTSAFFVPIATGFLLVACELGLYPGIRLSPVEEFRRLAVSVTAMFVMWTVGVILLVGQLAHQLVFLALAYVLIIAFLWMFRGFARRCFAKLRPWGFPTLVCGDDAMAQKVYHWLEANQHLGLRPVGVIGNPDALSVSNDDPWYFGSWSSAKEIARDSGAYWAVVVPPEDATASYIAANMTAHLSTIPHIQILSELTGVPDHWSQQQQLDGLPGIHLQQNLMLPLPRIVKRLMDITLTILIGIVLLPLLFYIAVAVKLSSRGPVLYGNERIGRDGRRFRVWKFRSMFTNGDAVLENYFDANPSYRQEWETTHKLKSDPRITRIGRFIRKTSLDELPQLFNVLRGDMSLVGPRPILPEEVERYGDYFSLYSMVSPGITGMWQVSGRSNTSYEERLQLVAYYVRNWSLSLDVFLLLKTIRIVLLARGAY